MFVIKRSGIKESVSFDKIRDRLNGLAYGLECVNVCDVAKEVIRNLSDGITTEELDRFAIERCASKSVDEYEYGVLAARLAVNNHHKNVSMTFVEKTRLFGDMLSEKYVKFVLDNAAAIDALVDYDRDYLFDYFGFSTLYSKYLLRVDSRVIESPQDLIMRVCVQLELCCHTNDYAECLLCNNDVKMQNLTTNYELFSMQYFCHATPTLYNSGLKRAALSSCFLFGMNDNAEDILDKMRDSGIISKHAGGIGIHMHEVRSNGMLIKGTNGRSKGVTHFCKLADKVMETFDQGGGKRPGSMAVYLEMHHPDLMAFLKMKEANANEKLLQHIFPALWMCDLFMVRVERDEMWSFFDSTVAPELNTLYASEYNMRYTLLEKEGKYTHQLRAREVWQAVYHSQCATGTPYIGFKDRVNKANNQCNMGTVRSSNLCMEIVEYSDSEHYASCNLASICLPKFISNDDDFLDWELFERVVRQLVRNLNAVIDTCWYSLPQIKKTNELLRPIGIGVQGLHDVFFKLEMPFESDEARALNREIYEKLYYYALSESMELARRDGKYEKFEGSLLSMGMFNHDMYMTNLHFTVPYHAWDELLGNIFAYGTRNSLLIAQMPTASTSQIMGNCESIDPLTNNIYRRDTISGEYLVINKYLVNALKSAGLYTKKTLDHLSTNNGSVQSLPDCPDHIKAVYKTCWEISQKSVIDLAADRQIFIDQSQSMNLFVEDLTFAKFNSMLFYAWKSQLKTGVYYLRTRAAAEAKKIVNDCESCQ